MTKLEHFYGKDIRYAELVQLDGGEKARVIIIFHDDSELHIFDDTMKCCERRYMSTDDDFDDLRGNLLHIKVKKGPTCRDDGHNYHDTAFLEIATDEGFVTVVTHSEHNGYYGSFDIAFRGLDTVLP